MTFLLVISDGLAIAVAFTLAYALRRFGPFSGALEPLLPLNVYLTALPFAVLLFLAIAGFRALYRPHRRLNPRQEAYAVSKAATIWALFIMSASYLVKQDYSRIIVVATWLGTLVTLPAGRLIANRMIRFLARRGLGRRNVLVVGTGKPARAILQELQRYERLGYRIIGYAGVNAGNGETALGNIGDVPRLITEHGIHQVYIADPSLAYAEILNLVHACPKPDVEFRVTADLFSRFHQPRSLTALEELASLDLKKAQPNALHRAAKRSLDLILGSLLLAASSPLWLVFAIIIRRDSAGPAIILQPRVGSQGKIFTLYKFRTMNAHAELDASPPSDENDARITRVGRFLRRTSLDELPQLWNVIRGDMSLVGPRPELVSLAAGYRGWQRRRFDAKPGLTGLWQILGRKDLTLEQKLEYDFYYVNNQTLRLDLVILARTIPQILFGRGAY